MAELCDEHAPNTLLTVARIDEAGVREAYRVIESQSADDQFAIHGDVDDGHSH